jgi:hypothetical protein
MRNYFPHICNVFPAGCYLLLAQLRGSGSASRRCDMTIAAPNRRSVNCRSMMPVARNLLLHETNKAIVNT